MLGYWQRTKGPIKRSPCPSDQFLFSQSLKIHNPDPGHFVHCDKGTLERVVQGVILRVSDGQVSNKVKSFTKVRVPNLVASGEGLESSLVDNEAFFKWSF